MKYIFTIIKQCYLLLPKKSQKKLQSAIKQRMDSRSKIEFENGEVLRVWNIDLKSNSIHQMKVRAQFHLIDFLDLLSVVLCISTATYSFVFYFSLVCLICRYIIQGIQVALVLINEWNEQENVNRQQCTVFRNLRDIKMAEGEEIQTFETIQWRQVHVGQIVCLQRGEIAPADLLILDSSEEFLHFQSELRFPCSATFTPINSSQKGVIIDFAINFSGTIQFKNNQGTLKLKNDPKATQFTKENMIFREELLERTDWVYGIALVVGSNCQKLKIQSKQKKRQQNEFPWTLILYVIALIPMITYDQSLKYPQYEIGDYALLYMMINSFTIEFAKSILHLIHMVHHQRQYRKVKEQVSFTQKIDILEEREEYILMSTSSKESNQQKQKQRDYTQKGCLYLENQSLVDISKTDLLVLESPESMFTKKYRVAQLFAKDIHYNLNYQRLIDRVIQMENKCNSHRVLINTNKSDIYEEMKPDNLDMLIKRTPPLFSSQTSDETARIMITYEKKIEEKVSTRKYSSVPKPITNSVSAHSSSVRLGSENDSKPNSPRVLKKQKSMRLPTSKFANKSQNIDTPNGHYRKRLSSGEGLIGEYQNETNFIENLICDDGQVHEILLSILLCNDLYSYFDPESRQVVDVYENPYDQFLINFASLFDYSLQHSSKIDNNKPYYLVQKMTKRYVRIQGETKVFEILAILKSTKSRKQKLSIMVRDPESFLLEEGALLYTREQTFQLEEGNSLNEKLHQMLSEGLISFVYSKRQLTSKEAQDILRRLSSPIELDVDDYYVQLEKSSKVQFILGIKRHIDAKLQLIAKTFDRDPTLKQNLFITLKDSLIQPCLLSDMEYNHLTVFLINFKVILSSDCIVHLHEHDTQMLIFKFRQHISYLLENQGILNASPNQENQRLIVINEDALLTIKASRYLKHHLQLIIRFSKGVVAYKLSAKSKGLLIKLLQSQYKVITTIGASSNNSLLFNKSDYALNIKKSNNISKAGHQIKKMSEIIQLLFVASRQLREQYTQILKHQIYRSILIGLQFYNLGFFHIGIDYTYFLLFTLLLSNTSTIILKISVMELKLEYTLEEVKIDRQRDNHICYLVKILIEAFTVMAVFHMFEHTDSINQVVLLITNIEFMEKAEFMIMHKQRYLIAFSTIVLTVLLAQLAYASQYHFEMAEYFTPYNLFLAIISSFLCVCIKILTLIIFNSSVLDYQDALFKLIKGNVRVIEENSVIQKRQQDTLQSISDMFKEKDIMDEQLQKLINGNDSLHVDALTALLRFSDKQTEKDYDKFISSQPDMQLYGMIFFEICILGIRIYLQQSNDSSSILIILIVQFSVQICLYMISSMVQNRQISYIIQISRWLFQILCGGFIYRVSNNNINFLTFMLYTLSFCMTFHSRLGLVFSMGLLILNMIVEIIQQAVYLEFDQNELAYLITKAAFIMIHLLVGSYLIIYRWEYLQRYSYIFSNKLLQEQKKLNDTLGLLMPRFIKERMTKGQISISEDQGEVSVLFCDICDFDAIIQSKGEKIVEFLDPIFRQFDQLCQSNDVQKIETVGKTYMAAAGLKDYDIVMNQKHQNSTQRVLEMAIGMMNIIRNMKYDEEKEIVLKIGIHYGRVVAGVIGAHKPQFSLIGDTVNTTSRVCSTGDKGYITVSEQAYHKVNHLKYEFILKQVEAKGKGLINTYQLQIKGKTNSATLKYSPSKSILQQRIFKQQISFKINSPLNKNLQNKTPSTPRIVKKVSMTAKKSIEIHHDHNLKNSIELNNEQALKQDDDLNNLLAVPGQFMRSKSRSLNKVPSSEVVIVIEKSQQLESKTPKRQRGSIFNPNVVRRKTVTGRQTKIITDNNIIADITAQVGKFDSQLQNIQDFKQQRSEPYNEIDLNQVEIPKKVQILKQQQNLTFEFINQLLRHKVDTYQNIVEESIVYDGKDHVAYYSIYEAYSQIDRSIMFMLLRNLVFIIIVNLLYFLLYTDMNGYITQQYILFGVQITYSLIISLTIFRLKHHINRLKIQVLLVKQFVLNMIISLLQLILISQDQESILQIAQITTLYLNIQQLQIFENNHLRKIQLLLVAYMIVVISMDKYWIPLLIYSVGAVGMIYFIQKRQLQILVQNYETNLQLETQKQKQDTILQHLLPNHTFEKFMSEHSQTEGFTDVFEDATILFADIAGFTKYSSSVQPEQVVTMLRSLFISFDKCCHELNVYKLYTIGDCYVCMGIIDANNRNPAEEVFLQIYQAINVALFGLKMIEIINNIKKIPEFQHLNMRIGVHTGKIIGGVVGIDVVRYDIYGEDVTIANKMESNGKEGHMMVSASTMELLEENTEDMFLFEESTSVFIPSRNENIEGYLTSFNESFIE